MECHVTALFALQELLWKVDEEVQVSGCALPVWFQRKEMLAMFDVLEIWPARIQGNMVIKARWFLGLLPTDVHDHILQTPGQGGAVG